MTRTYQTLQLHPAWTQRPAHHRALALAAASFFLVVAFVLLAWELRDIAVPLLLLTWGLHALWRHHGPLTRRERILLRVGILLGAFFLIGPFVTPTQPFLRLVVFLVAGGAWFGLSPVQEER